VRKKEKQTRVTFLKTPKGLCGVALSHAPAYKRKYTPRTEVVGAGTPTIRKPQRPYHLPTGGASGARFAADDDQQAFEASYEQPEDEAQLLRQAARSRREADNKAKADSLNKLMPRLVDNFLVQRGEVGKNGRLLPHELLQQRWSNIVETSTCLCPCCPGQALCTPRFEKGAPRVLLVDTTARTMVDWPMATCLRCESTFPAEPSALSVFPATPSKFEAVYTFDLLQLTRHHFLSGHVAMNHWQQSLNAAHLEAGCCDGTYDAAWQNMGWAFKSWQLLDSKLAEALASAGAPELPICPACSTNVVFIMDACFGIRHFRASGKSSSFQEPDRFNDRFIPHAALMACLEASADVVRSRGKLQDKCSQFKAVGSTVVLSANHYNINGLFAGCCECGIIHSMSPIVTPGEAFGYAVAALNTLLSPGLGFEVKPPGTPLPRTRDVLEKKSRPLLQGSCYDIACAFLIHWT